MKIIYAIIAYALLSINAFAQAPNWIWAKSAGGDGNDNANSIAADASGNVYVVGEFWSNAIVFGNTTLTNADNTGNTTDMYLVKYNANGNVLWAKKAGGNGEDGANSIAIDASGNVYITGWFYSPTIVFDNTTLTNTDNTGSTYDIHIVKYDANGNVLWAKKAGSNNNETGRCVATDAFGNVYITGWFYSSSLIFGTYTLTNFDNTGTTNDIYILKLDANGNVLWAKSAGGDDRDFGESVKIDASGNVYVTGGFYSSNLMFGATILTAIIGANGPADDFYIVKYDASGNVLWAKKAGGNGSDDGNSIAIDASGNVFVTGWFYSPSIVFGSITLTNTNPFGNNIPSDMFIVKYAPNGNALWAKSAGGFYEDYGNSIATDAMGNVYVTGEFWSDIIFFGSTFLTNGSPIGFSGPNTYVVKYNSDGNVLWAESASGDRFDFGNSIATDLAGNVFVTGGFWSPSIVFGSTILTNADNTGDTYDVFIVKISTTVGTKEASNDLKVSIYPNPFTSQTTIVFLEEQKYTIIKILDVLGKEIRTLTAILAL